MRSRDVYEAIYEAAKIGDEAALTEALKYGVIGVIRKVSDQMIASPIYHLAYENNQTAVAFLLKHGASRESAVAGYAHGGHINQVNALLAQEGVSKNEAAFGYAVGGYSDQVKALLDTDSNKEAALIGYYAIGGHIDQVKALLDMGGNIENAIRGYAIGGHTDQVNALLLKNNFPQSYIDSAVTGYAFGGHIEKVGTLLKRRGSTKKAALFGYAYGGHTDQVNAMAIYRDDKNDCIDAIVNGYALGGHIDQVNMWLNEKHSNNEDVAIQGYADNEHYDKNTIALFTKINELNKYGKKLIDEGHPRKGQNAIKLAQNIHTQVIAFAHKTSDAETISANLSKLIADGKKSMGEDRKLKDIIAHIVLALTGIGVIIILAKKLLSESKSGFLNSTKRQKMLSDIDKDLHKVTKRKP